MEEKEKYIARNVSVTSRSLDTELVDIVCTALEKASEMCIQNNGYYLREYDSWSPLGIIANAVVKLERFQEIHGNHKWLASNTGEFYVLKYSVTDAHFLPEAVAEAIGTDRVFSFPIIIKERRKDGGLHTNIEYWTDVFSLGSKNQTFAEIAAMIRTYVLGNGYSIMGE